MASERAVLDALRDAREAVERAVWAFQDLRKQRPIGCGCLTEALDRIDHARSEAVRFVDGEVPVARSRRRRSVG